MRGAKQGFSEGLELARMLLDLGPEQIGEKVAAHISHDFPVFRNLLASALSVAHEIGLNPDQRGDIVNNSAAATEDVETGDERLIRVNVNKGKSDRYFEFRIAVLRHHGHRRECECECSDSDAFKPI